MTNRTLLLVLVVAACGDDGSSSAPIPEACNPLGGEGCLLPWPSLSYMKADGTSATGYRIDLPIAAMPVNHEQVPIDPAPLNARWDGFSPTAPLLAMFPQGVSPEGLPSWKAPEASLAPASPIVVLDLDRGERAPFFAEVDQNVSDPADRALVIRPLMRLHEKTHYAVAIRRTVKSADGSELPISPGFAALRDGKRFDHPRFAAMQARGAEMFDKLAAAGVARSELVLAWDFVTASDDMLRADLTAMRAAALPAIGDKGANLGATPFTTQEQPNTAQSYKRYLGTFKSPDFLTDGEADGSVMQRDAAGKPQLHGLRDANFAAIVPACVTTQPLPRPTIIFGHGLFGSSADYLNDGFVQQLAEDRCLVIIAGDFIGLTSRQLGAAALAVTDLNRGGTVTEKLGQSIIDFMALESIARGPMATSPQFRLGGTPTGAPVIDPSNTFYVGGSLGGIMGNVLLAYDPNLTRGVLAVPGGAWSLLIERSNAWNILKTVVQGSYRDPQVYALNVALFGMAFEPYDPITTAAHVIKDPLFGNPVKNILMWYSIGDCLVSNITTEMVARTMGLDMLGPSVKAPWGLAVKPGAQDNGVVVFDDHPAPLPPDTNEPPAKDNGTHAGINRKAAALRMVQRFLLPPDRQASDGCALAASPAACDCATGACD
jgi:pimeloyl-ACP methyl ester carboxylesterase